MAVPDIPKERLQLPLVGSPLFIISNPDLVIAQCKAGIVGSFPALNARPAEVLEQWLQRITSELDAYNQANPDEHAAPFAVNQIVHKSNTRLEHDVEMCVKYKVPIVITSLGARTEVNDAIHSYGGIVLHDVITNKFAKKAIEKGADGLIAVAAGADIVYSNLFTGVHGNYLRPSIINAGLDPDKLAHGSAADMDFSTIGNDDAKAWKDIWGCGQGIGAIKKIQGAGELIEQLKAEYQAARERLLK